MSHNGDERGECFECGDATTNYFFPRDSKHIFLCGGCLNQTFDHDYFRATLAYTEKCKRMENMEPLP